MMLTGNVIAILLALTSGALDTVVKVRSGELERPKLDIQILRLDHQVSSIAPPEAFQPLRELTADEGFLFIDGKYCHPSSTLCWSDGLLTVNDPSSCMVAMETSSPLLSNTMSDAFVASPELAHESSFALSEMQFSKICNALSTGGVVNVPSDGELYCAGFSQGGFEVLEAINTPQGIQRQRLIDEASDRSPAVNTVETRSWLSSYQPDQELSGRIGKFVNHVNQIEKSNIVAATAIRRFNSWSYPLTITAMMIFVISMGSLLAARPHELVAVAHTESDVSVNRFLWLIGGMSVIDLVWTLLAHQANQIAEVNPVGNVLLGDAQRTILFKALATILAIGILFRARHSAFARKACWWVCLTLALLMARWVLVSGVST